MDVTLPPELEHLVMDRVNSGRYGSPTDVVRAALGLLEHEDKSSASELLQFNEGLIQRLASLDRGESLDGDEFFKELEREESNLHNRE